jgi:hypothetical protein
MFVLLEMQRQLADKEEIDIRYYLLSMQQSMT